MIAGFNPRGRAGKSKEISEAVGYLAGEKSIWVAWQVLRDNGDQSQNRNWIEDYDRTPIQAYRKRSSPLNRTFVLGFLIIESVVPNAMLP